jgi:hypothetical protein
MKRAPGKQSKISVERVVTQRSTPESSTTDEMRPHYDFDYSKSRPNRFAARLTKDTIAVVLDPDVATVFQ